MTADVVNLFEKIGKNAKAVEDEFNRAEGLADGGEPPIILP